MSRKSPARRLLPGAERDRVAADLKTKYEAGASIRALAEETGRVLRRCAPSPGGCRGDLPFPRWRAARDCGFVIPRSLHKIQDDGLGGPLVRTRLTGRVATLARSGRVGSAPTAQYATLLRDRGMAAQDIADASGVAVTLVRRLLKPVGPRPRQIARTTAEAVLGIPMPDDEASTLPRAGRGLVPADEATRQLRTLAERGWPATHLARRLQVHPHTVAAVRGGYYTRISIAIDQRIRQLHAALMTTDPVTAGIRPSDIARTRTWAERRDRATSQLSQES